MRSLVAVAILASAAHADTKSWAALKNHVPAGANGVVSGDLAAARALPVFGKAFAALTGSIKELGQMLAIAKQKCGLDVVKQIDDATYILASNQHGDHGVIAIGVNGVDEAQLGKCLTAIEQEDDPKGTITSKKVGALTKYWQQGKSENKDPLYVTWLAKDVIAVGLDAGHPDDLNAALKGGAPSAELAAMLAKIDTRATAWGAGTHATSNVASFWGTAKLADGLALDLHITAIEADKAKGLRDETLELLQTAPKRVPATAKALGALTVGGTGAEFTLKGTIAGDALVDLATNFEKAF